MKKRTISKLKSFFGSKSKAKRQAQLEKIARTPSPEPLVVSPVHNGDLFRPIAKTPPPPRVGSPPSPPVPTKPKIPVAPQPAGPLPLLPCVICERTFLPESLEKHTKICEKTASKKRKTFDSSRQRREGTDLEQYLPKNFGLPENSPFLEKSPPHTAKTLPRQRNSSVRSTVTKGGADLQKCPHCSRAFGMRAFERHVEWCADKAKILPSAPVQPPAHIAHAKQRLNARTQYKAPPVRGRRSSQSRDKSSNSRSASVESSRGVSPPPRDYGDYHHTRPSRTRTSVSESVSSNECNSETPPHVPVIRNARAMQNSSGDTVKARQARLARDISSNRSKLPSISQNEQDSNVIINSKKSTNKIKQKAKIPNKEQKIIKIEQSVQIHNENLKKKLDSKVESINISKNKPRKNESKCDVNKTSIPIPKIRTNKIVEKRIMNSRLLQTKIQLNNIQDPDIENNNNEKIKENYLSSDSLDTYRDKHINNDRNSSAFQKKKNKFSGQNKKLVKVKTTNNAKYIISSDSLESAKDLELPNSIGTNTDFFCPSAPCTMHTKDNAKDKRSNQCMDKNNSLLTYESLTEIKDDFEIELLYKNSTIASSCDIDTSKIESKKNLEPPASVSQISPIKYSVCLDNEKLDEIHITNLDLNISDDSLTENLHDNIHDISEPLEESIQEVCKHDSNDEFEITNDHDSGNTYTKFTEDPKTFDEFMEITDQLMNNCNVNEEDDEISFDIHTPNTNSLETLNDDINNCDIIQNSDFNNSSGAFACVKENFKDFLIDSKSIIIDNDQNIENHTSDYNSDDEIINEQITTKYESSINIISKPKTTKVFEFSLPSIQEKPVPKVNSKNQRVNKSNSKYKQLRDFKKGHSNFKTFIKECVDDSASEAQSISSEAPPLKLPRIENKRLDDSYDPFLSAARQMKELMSSDTNIPKKLQQTPKDNNRTLPVLRPNKEKSPPTYSRTDNTKMLKESLNKSYQKTPTLQRMKSFGTNYNENNSYGFGGRSSSFRINKTDNKKSNPNLNSTFTKSSKENISNTDKSSFNRNSSLNRSFSSYTASSYSTPKPRDKIPKISTSYHSFQRTTIKQPVKLDKIKKEVNKKEFVNLDSILADDNSSMTDSNYIDPRLINENDNLPLNVNIIRDNPDMISSMESLQTTENLPAKFESFNMHSRNIFNKSQNSINNLNKTAPSIDDLTSQYDKIMNSLEQSIASKASVRDDESMCEDFDLEEFMTSFDEELHKAENKRTCSSTTRIVKHALVVDRACSNSTSDATSDSSSPKVVSSKDSAMPYAINKSNSLNFSNNNITTESMFPSSIKRSNSNLLDSLQKKNYNQINDNKYGRYQNNGKVEQLENDIMQSLKEFDNFYETEKSNGHVKQYNAHNIQNHNGNTVKRDTRIRNERKSKKQPDEISNGTHTPNGKQCNDSAYSSLNRISPSKLSLCPVSASNGQASLEKIPPGSDSGGSHRENELRSLSSEEFLAMERSTEVDVALRRGSQEMLSNMNKEISVFKNEEKEKRSSSRASSRRSPLWRSRPDLSSSGSESSLHPTSRPTRFCHECGSKFPVDSAKFCIQCGVKRLVV